MGVKTFLKRSNAVSEVVGAMILVLIAVVTFASIYIYLMPTGPDIETSTKLEGYVNEKGSIVLSHKGGETINTYKLIIREPDGAYVGSKILENDSWKIGQSRYPLDQIGRSDIKLIGETDLEVSVYAKNRDGSYQQVFNGILTGKIERSDPEIYLISSLKQNTTDEDLICFSDNINSEIGATSYIYSWVKNDIPIYNVLMPFDIENSTTTRDYSGNEKNASAHGANWTSNGRIGGCYQFDGDDYLMLPSCFDTGYIDKITVETWIKTDTPGAIASFDKEKLWELDVSNDGKILWSNTANTITADTEGTTIINDNNWHHIAVTYDSSTGENKIFVDGKLENIENAHDIGNLLGDGTNQQGYIGRSAGGDGQATWNTLTYDDFEDGWGNYTDGGWDCTRTSNEKHQGSYSARIRDDNRYASSFYHTNGIDVDTLDYTSIKVDFWWMRSGNYWDVGDDEDWWLRYYNGIGLITVLDMNYPGGYSQDTWYHTFTYINESDYAFPTDMKLRFQCDATSDYDIVYLDEIYVNATTGETSISNFSGYIDEFSIYNHLLSEEQIYQNYISGKNKDSEKDVIVSEETQLEDIWKCNIIPINSLECGDQVESNILEIKNYLEE